MPAEGKTVVAVEKPSAMAAVRQRSQKAAATKRPASRTAATGQTCTLTGKVSPRGSSQGESAKNFLVTRVIVRAAMNASNEPGGRRCNDSARINAGAR